MMSSVRRLRVSAPIALLLLAGMLALSHPAAASTQAATGSGNLLVNPHAAAGDVSAQGWDAVTIPGWQVAAGLPTVVRYGTSGFPAAGGAWPAGRGRVFAGGAGGTARLTQGLSLRLPSGKTAPDGTRYRLSAWLGGTKTSSAELTVRFLDAKNHQLGSRTIGPVGRTRHATFVPRDATGVLPTGTASAQVTVVLATSLTNFNGPDAPQTSYN